MFKKVLAISVSLFMVLSVFFTVGIVYATTPAAFANGSFESLDNSMPKGWFLDSYEIRSDKNYNKTTAVVMTDDKGKDGNNYVRITNSAPDDSRLCYSLSVKQNQKYKVTCWAKAENIPTDETKIGANISLDGNLSTSADLKGTTDWTQLTFYFENLDPKSVTLTVGIGSYYKDNTGVAYFDDVKVEEIKDFPQNIKSAVAGENNTSATDESSNMKNIIIIVVIIALGVIAIIVGAYLLIIKKKNNGEAVAKDNTEDDKDDEAKPDNKSELESESSDESDKTEQSEKSKLKDEEDDDNDTTL